MAWAIVPQLVGAGAGAAIQLVGPLTIISLLSSAYMDQHSASCLWLFMHCVILALSFARCNADSSSAARMPMIAITTSSSTSVNAEWPVAGLTR
jgi:hypothetical protein